METNKVTIQKIQEISEQENWDVCQIGVELANQFSENETEYDNIWLITQDAFKDCMMEGLRYIVKQEYKNTFVQNLLKKLKYKYKCTACSTENKQVLVKGFVDKEQNNHIACEKCGSIELVEVKR